METDRQPESEDAKLRQRLEELLRHARELEEATRAPVNLPRVTEASRLVVPLHESFLPGSILTTLFRNPKTDRTVSFKREDLGELDGMTTEYLLNYYQSQALFTADDAARLRSDIELFSRQHGLLLRNAGSVSYTHLKRRGFFFQGEANEGGHLKISTRLLLVLSST